MTGLGVMVGYLLARAGVDVVVLEKHQDFLRDFRGDTVHPSTLQIMSELGILDGFLRRPHQKVHQISGFVGGEPLTVANFSHLPTACPYVAMMPQWDFLDFLSGEARKLPAFKLVMGAEVRDLIIDQATGRVQGVKVKTSGGEREVRAELVIAADGRGSVVRERSGLEVKDLGAPIDVLWMRLSRRDTDPSQALGYFDRGTVFVMIDRGDYWRCAFVIPKGGFEALRTGEISVLHQRILAEAPWLVERVAELRSWDDVKLLTVRVDRLKRWYRDGLLCIGDAAHAMSPIGGVGINLAIQDAVATANILASTLRNHNVRVTHLRAVQQRRMLPTLLTQGMQVFAHDHVIGRVMDLKDRLAMPWSLRLFRKLPVLQRLPARFVGLGVRPEHVASPSVV